MFRSSTAEFLVPGVSVIQNKIYFVKHESKIKEKLPKLSDKCTLYVYKKILSFFFRSFFKENTSEKVQTRIMQRL